MKNTTFLNNELISELLSVTKGPCISLYLPTHRGFAEKKQDIGQFKTLVKQAEKSLSRALAEPNIQKHLEPFEDLSIDREFWNQTAEGIAIFSSPDYFKIVNLHEPVEPLAIVAESFHTKPLRHYLQTLERYHVLGLNLKEFKLYEGNRHLLREVELAADIPKTLVEALGEELTEKHSTVASYGGTGNQSVEMHHGHGGKKAEIDKDTERFFRIVAANIEEHYSKPTGWPLILAALPEHHNTFQKVNKNSYLHPKAIAINPTAISTDKLKTLAWEILEPEYAQKQATEVDRFNRARAAQKGSDDHKEVAHAALEGKVDTLLVEANRHVEVKITNLISGNTKAQILKKPAVDDLLDDLGELVIKMGGKVIVLPKEKMPSESGLAAIYRY